MAVVDTDRRTATTAALVDLEITFEQQFVDLVNELHRGCQSIHFVVGSGPGASLARQLSKRTDALATFCKSAGDKSVEAVASESSLAAADVVVGIGGGSVIDRAKVAAKVANARLLVIPTVLSQDGLYSQHAVVRSPKGTVERFKCSSPDRVLPAVDVIERAPEEFSRACVGDLISNFSAVEDCKLAAANGAYKTNAAAIAMSLEAANIAASWNPAANKMELFPAVRLSGEAMLTAGNSSPCSGAEHKIVSALEQIGVAKPHGLAVGLSTVFVSALRGPNILAEMLRVAHAHSLPTMPADLGIENEVFIEAVTVAATLRPSRFTILEARRFEERDLLDALEQTVTLRRDLFGVSEAGAQVCTTL